MSAAREALRGRRILVVGLGDLGGRIAVRLAEAGARVTGVRRSAGGPPGIEVLPVDVRDPAACAALPEETEALVLCLTPDRRDEAGYRETFVGVARNVARRLARAPLAGAVFVSSTAVYGQGEDAVIDDATAAAGGSWRGTVLREAEAAFDALPGPTTALRLSGLYGPGRTALLERVLRGVGAPAEPVHWTNRIHRDDAAEAVVHLLARAAAGAPLPSRVIGTDPAPAPRHEVLAWLAARLDVALEEDAGAGGDRAPSRRILPRFLEETGFRWRHPDYRSGFEEVVAELERDGGLEVLRRRVAAART
jgi:nucleoside-diphosphate-sugar epimerase